MTGSNPAVVSNATADRPDPDQIETRFGKVTVYRKNPIMFPNGLLGMPERNQFCMTNFPSEKMARFKLLQSLEDDALSFITLPVDLQNPLVDRSDIEAAAKELDIPLEHLATLFIVSVHRGAGSVRLSVNARAPVLLHSARRLATQHVFANPKYDVRQMLSF